MAEACKVWKLFERDVAANLQRELEVVRDLCGQFLQCGAVVKLVVEVVSKIILM